FLITRLNRPWDRPQLTGTPPADNERTPVQTPVIPVISAATDKIASNPDYPLADMSQLPLPSSGHYSLLVFRSGPQKGERFCLDNNWPGGVCVIGRSDVQENQLIIQHDDRIGRIRHAEVT